MQIPVTLAFENLSESDAVERSIWEHARRLEHFFDRITSCRVTIAAPHRRHRQGCLYSVRIDMTLPGGHEIVVNRQHRLDHAHEDVYVAVRDAFLAARRRLEDYADRLRDGASPRRQPSVMSHS